MTFELFQLFDSAIINETVVSTLIAFGIKVAQALKIMKTCKNIPVVDDTMDDNCTSSHVDILTTCLFYS